MQDAYRNAAILPARSPLRRYTPAATARSAISVGWRLVQLVLPPPGYPFRTHPDPIPRENPTRLAPGDLLQSTHPKRMSGTRIDRGQLVSCGAAPAPWLPSFAAALFSLPNQPHL